jgi:uncharacterized membrane protein
MIFLSKRTIGNAQQSGKDTCLSFLGFILAIGFIGGLGALIYGKIKYKIIHIISLLSLGLIKVNFIWIAIGGVVLGISVFLSIIFILMIIFCHNNNHVDSNTNLQ